MTAVLTAPNPAPTAPPIARATPGLARNLRHALALAKRNLIKTMRTPEQLIDVTVQPIVFLLLFVYVFGGQLSAGLGRGLAGGHTGRAGYLNYVTPGILLITVAAAVQGTAIVVAMDMTGGIIDRFRTMAIARACVLTGHVLASLIQSLFSILVVLGAAVAVGFRPTADAASWLAAIGVLALFALALIWLATALGLAAKSVETASNTPMFLTLLPFLGSGFVPTASMPAGLRQFATYQPFTPVTETVRGLLTGTRIGGNAIAAIAWSVGIALASYLWARHLYSQRRPR
jgi:ABC-2 type transport system permease protein